MYGRVDISLLQPAKKQSNAAGAEHHIAHEHVVSSDCVKWMWLILSLAVTDEGRDGECRGKAWVATCGVGEAKKRNDLCGDFFFFF